jgi:hypothetical protein
MSIPNEALQKVCIPFPSSTQCRPSPDRESASSANCLLLLEQLVREIESQAIAAQQQIGLARTQMTAKQREQRLVKLTLSEMASLPEDAVVYEGVGKMYVPCPKPPRYHTSSIPNPAPAFFRGLTSVVFVCAC